MKHIIKTIFLVGACIIPASSFADDINILTSNRIDIATADDGDPGTINDVDSARPMVLFLVDNAASIATAEVDPNQCGDGEGTGEWNPEFLTNYPIADGIYNFHDASGDANNHGNYNLASVCERLAGEATTTSVKSAKDVLKLVLKKRPDLKIGVQLLNDSQQATEILALMHHSDLENCDHDNNAGTAPISCMAAIDKIGDANNTTEKMALLGGLQDIKADLSANDSPLNPANTCSSLELIVIANGGWKDDVNSNFDDNKTALVDIAADFHAKKIYRGSAASSFAVNSNCGGVKVSVLGYNASTTNDTTVAPLFANFAAGTSAAHDVVSAGGGIVTNSVTASDLAGEVLGYLDYNYPKATTLVTPSTPVSIRRNSNIDRVIASAFKPSGETIWQGALTSGTIAQWKNNEKKPISNDQLSASFINSARSTKLYLSGDGTSLTELTAANNILTTEDITWLKKSFAERKLGDSIHFKPLAIDYGGASNAHTIYTVIGTNHGTLHMFNSAGNELWSLVPSEVQKLIPALRNSNKAPDYAMVDHLYGIDGAPSVFVHDANKDGKIVSGDGDRVLLYFGLRRGGASTIALDITTPTTPIQLWKHGKMDLDYGPFYAAEDIQNSDKVTVPDALGGCAVFAARSITSMIGGLMDEACTCSNPPTAGGNERCVSGNRGLECTIEFNQWGESGEELVTVIAQSASNGSLTGMGISQLDCFDSIADDQKSATLKSRPGASQYSMEWNPWATPKTCGHDDHNTGGIAVGKATTYLNKAFVGFGMNSIPANAIITSATLRFKHISIDSNNNDPHGIYDKHIYVNATMGKRSGSSGAYFGDTPYRDSTYASVANCTDFDDNGRLKYIAKIEDPLPSATNSLAYRNGTPWAEADIYESSYFPYFYDNGEINAKGMYALTYLFREKVEDATIISNCRASTHPAADFLNDKTTCLAWTQFKLQTIDVPDAKQNAVYEAGALGPLLDQNWADAPELVLTWKLRSDLAEDELAAYVAVENAFNNSSLTDSQKDAVLSGASTCISGSGSCTQPANFPE